MLSCDLVENVSHISQSINALQPVVFQSTKVMMEEGILTKTAVPKSNKKQLILTDKGLAIAILTGIKHKKLDEFFDMLGERYKFFEAVLQQKQGPTRQRALLKKALEYMVEHGWYDRKIKMDHNQRLDLFGYLVPYMLIDASEVRNVVGLMENFGVDKKVFGEALLEKLKARLASTAAVVNEYQRCTKIAYSEEQVISLVKSFYRDIEEVSSDIRTTTDKKGVKEIRELTKRANPKNNHERDG
jgi:hypothetical protein